MRPFPGPRCWPLEDESQTFAQGYSRKVNHEEYAYNSVIAEGLENRQPSLWIESKR